MELKPRLAHVDQESMRTPAGHIPMHVLDRETHNSTNRPQQSKGVLSIKMASSADQLQAKLTRGYLYLQVSQIWHYHRLPRRGLSTGISHTSPRYAHF